MSSQFIKTGLLLKIFFFSIPLYITAQGIYNTSGSHFVTNSNVYIVINNAGLKNDGSFTGGSSTVSFSGTGSTANSFIAGTSSITFNNLVLSKTSNGMQLNSNISVDGILNLLSGDSIFLNNHNIDLGTTGSISGETNSKRITGLTGGYIQITKNLTAPANINPGNIGIEITSSANLGSTIIKRGHHQQSGASVYRYFDIIPTTNSGLDATLTFYYFHNELANVPENNLGIFESADGGSGWSLLGQDALNMGLDYVTKTSITEFDRFTLADATKPLPIHLLYLKAQFKSGQILLDWATASEQNNDHFDVERSADGIFFTKLGKVNSIGNSSVTQYYQFVDANPIDAFNYYRLKQVDIDNHAAYSYTVKIKAGSKESGLINLYPNPAQSMVKLLFILTKENDNLMQIVDMNGKVVQGKLVHCSVGLNIIEWNISSLPSGVYNIKIIRDNIKNVQFVKN